MLRFYLRTSHSMLFLVLLLLLALSGCNIGQNAQPERKEGTTVESIDTKNEQSPSVYVNNREANTVQIIDPTTYSVVSTIDVGEQPTYLQVTPDGRYTYVVNSKSEDVSIIDTKINEVVKTIPVGKTPKGVNFTTDGKWAYVINEGEDTVTVIDVKQMEKTTVIKTGKFPHNGISSPDSSKFYVTNTASNSISVIDTESQSVIKTIEDVKDLPHNVSITPDGKTLWVTLTKSNALGIVDLEKEKMVETIPVGTGHHVIDLTNDGNLAYVANIGDDSVTVIDTKSKDVVKSIQVGQGPHGIAITPDNKKVYVPVTEENKLVVIDTPTNEVTQTIETEAFPFFTATVGSHGTSYYTKKSMAADNHSEETVSETQEAPDDSTKDSSKTVLESSPLIKTDKTYSYTFNKVGKYAIHCAPHPYMTMTIIVDEGEKMDEQKVEIKDYTFLPETMKITPGTTVKWINKDTVEHNAVIEK
jgi:YVTN family beta-propeller protein